MTQLTGLGSGLDIKGMVENLRSATEQPQAQRLNQKETDARTEISSIGRLRSALSSFNTALQGLQNTSDFAERNVSNSDENVLDVTVDSSAPQGNFQVEVLALAQAQKLSSGAFGSSTESVGTGTLTLANQVGDSFDIVIEAGSDSLEDIRDAINNSGSNIGVSASVVKVSDTESRILLSSNDGGIDNQLTITAADDDGDNTDGTGLSQLTYDTSQGTGNLTELSVASDSSVMIDGLAITRSSNSLSDVIEGININLKNAQPGTTVNVGVTLNTESITKKVEEFVSAYNALDTQLDSLDSEDSALDGDFILRQVSSTVRNAITNTSRDGDDGYNTLFSIGVQIDRYGKATVDSSQLSTAINSNVAAVSQLFAGENGVSTTLTASIDDILSSDGSLSGRVESLNSILDSVSESRDNLTERMDMFEARMLKQLNSMDAIVAQMNGNRASLTNGLAALPNATG